MRVGSMLFMARGKRSELVADFCRPLFAPPPPGRGRAPFNFEGAGQPDPVQF